MQTIGLQIVTLRTESRVTRDDLQDVFEALRHVVVAIAYDAGYQRQDAVLVVRHVEADRLILEATKPAAVAIERFERALRNADLSIMPEAGRGQLVQLWNKVEHHGWSVRFAGAIVESTPLPSRKTIRIQETITGKLLRVEDGHALLRLPSGDARRFPVQSAELASKLAVLRFQQVSLDGWSERFVVNQQLAEFEILGLHAL